MKQFLILLSILCSSNSSFSQKNSFRVPDSLKNKSYTYLDDKIYGFRKDSSKAAPYLYTYLNRAINEKNWEEVVYAYQNIMHQSPDKIRVIYADSMVYAAKKSTDDALIGSAYLSKGIVFYGQKKYESAFDNYITANSYISLTDDKYQHNKVKYHMAQIKYFLGFYDEAISLFRDCLEYYKKEDTRAYLNCLHSLGVLNNKIGNYGLCSEINKKGISESERLKNLEMIPYFKHSEGINLYFKKNYGAAISNIESSLDSIHENKDFANEAVGNFFIGKSYCKSIKKRKPCPFF
ncbi:tetratricopeptide repeat protein [Flavobacterium sp. MMS24-S5]|uniref:tetratricopeptide repeat protein n=1 Tax=Flavobacterium sp. MMS24-S5 TaxID=3416605 RepID=UPI003D08F9CE